MSGKMQIADAIKPITPTDFTTLVEVYKEHGGANYLAIDFQLKDDPEKYQIIVRRLEGKSESEIISELKVMLRKVQGVLSQCINNSFEVNAEIGALLDSYKKPQPQEGKAKEEGGKC